MWRTAWLLLFLGCTPKPPAGSSPDAYASSQGLASFQLLAIAGSDRDWCVYEQIRSPASTRFRLVNLGKTALTGAQIEGASGGASKALSLFLSFGTSLGSCWDALAGKPLQVLQCISSARQAAAEGQNSSNLLTPVEETLESQSGITPLPLAKYLVFRNRLQGISPAGRRACADPLDPRADPQFAEALILAFPGGRPPGTAKP